MKTDKEIQDQINSAFSVLDDMEKAPVSPFLKNKVMTRLFEEEKERLPLFVWFSPKVQWAAFVCVVVVNVYVFMRLRAENYQLEVKEFASSYGLTIENVHSIFN